MQPCNLKDLSGWLESEVLLIPIESYRRVMLEVARNLDLYIKWPERAELLWDGCDRKREGFQKQKYHSYPQALKDALPTQRFRDGRSNGPAVSSYTVADGNRPARNNGRGWSIHHLYDGKFPYCGKEKVPPLQAVKDSRHFTQSAGLVAAHPLADALADEFEIFAWRLRAESFKRFGYDPEGAFTDSPDEFGFNGRKCGSVWYPRV